MSGPEFMNSAGMWGAVPNATFNASTLFGFLRFTKDLVLSRRRFMFLLVVLGGAFGALNRKISARERLKVRDASPVPCRRDGLSLSLSLPLSLSLRLSARPWLLPDFLCLAAQNLADRARAALQSVTSLPPTRPGTPSNDAADKPSVGKPLKTKTRSMTFSSPQPPTQQPPSCSGPLARSGAFAPATRLADTD